MHIQQGSAQEDFQKIVIFKKNSISEIWHFYIFEIWLFEVIFLPDQILHCKILCKSPVLVLIFKRLNSSKVNLENFPKYFIFCKTYTVERKCKNIIGITECSSKVQPKGFPRRSEDRNHDKWTSFAHLLLLLHLVMKIMMMKTQNKSCLVGSFSEYQRKLVQHSSSSKI